jgi:hypothetical protein
MCTSTFVATACTYTISIILDWKEAVELDISAISTDMISVIYTVDVVLWIAFISVGYRIFKREGGQKRRSEFQKILVRRLSLTVLILLLIFITRGA